MFSISVCTCFRDCCALSTSPSDFFNHESFFPPLLLYSWDARTCHLSLWWLHNCHAGAWLLNFKHAAFARWCVSHLFQIFSHILICFFIFLDTGCQILFVVSLLTSNTTVRFKVCFWTSLLLQPLHFSPPPSFLLHTQFFLTFRHSCLSSAPLVPLSHPHRPSSFPSATGSWWMHGLLLIAMGDGWWLGDDWWGAAKGANTGAARGWGLPNWC